MMDLIRGLAFESGWWSVGAWLATAAAFVVTASVIARTRNDLLVLAMVFAGPIASFALIGVLQALADPTPGCTYDCIGRLLLLGPAAGVFLGWAVGLLTGLALRARRPKSADLIT